MTTFASCIFEGTVVHKRLTPRRHGFAYRVFTLCLDVDEIDRLDQALKLFSRGRRNVLGFDDRDVGEPGSARVAEKIRSLLDKAGQSQFGARIALICYPRLLGYVFNPLSVYFCRNAEGRLGVVVYEVSNTFGERTSYVIPTDDRDDGRISQTCVKQLYVSPFTGACGSYGFHSLAPADRMVIGVNFREHGTPVLKTHFQGVRRPLTDASITGLVARYPLMTLKVITAIHVEAARLWAKGVPLVARHTSQPYSYAIVKRTTGEPLHD